MFVSQPVVIREYKQIIDNIYENIIKRENHLFTIDAGDKMEETLKNVLSKHGLDHILNEIDSSLIDEIKIHFSYERKKWEWTIVYQMLLKLSLRSVVVADAKAAAVSAEQNQPVSHKSPIIKTLYSLAGLLGIGAPGTDTF
jgi:hypothetical protein